MTLVSLDAIVQADATLIVGVIFLVALKQAWLGKEQKLSRSDLAFVLAATSCYIVSAFVAVLPDMASTFELLGFGTMLFGNPPIPANMAFTTGLSTFFSYGLFYVGMGLTLGAVYSMMRTEKGVP